MTVPPVVAIIAQGDMGAGIAARLGQRGCRVLTSLAGRSRASAARAAAAGMIDAGDAELAAADLFLSILPPADALALAERMAPRLGPHSAVYVDCNAISPTSVRVVAEVVQGAGAGFVDAGIIGGPPQPGGYTPAIYACGPQAPRFAALTAFGLDVRVLEGPVGQASAFKMCYAGLTKGLHAVGVSVMLGAIEAGLAEPLFQEMALSQPELLAYFQARTPGIFAKSYRWVAEMQEIGAFLGGGGQQLFEGAAQQFERLASDRAGDGADASALLAFLRQTP